MKTGPYQATHPFRQQVIHGEVCMYTEHLSALHSPKMCDERPVRHLGTDYRSLGLRLQYSYI